MPPNVASQFNSVFGNTKPAAPTSKVGAAFCHTTKAITLTDLTGKNPPVVLRGFQAENFKNSFMQMKKECPNLSASKAIGALSAPYTAHWLEI